MLDTEIRRRSLCGAAAHHACQTQAACSSPAARRLGHLQPARLHRQDHPCLAQGVKPSGQSEGSPNTMLSQSRGELSLRAQKNAQQEAASAGVKNGLGGFWWVLLRLLSKRTPTQTPSEIAQFEVLVRGLLSNDFNPNPRLHSIPNMVRRP